MRKIIIGLAPTLLAISTGAYAQTPGWKVSEVSGNVRLVENGRARAAVRGALLSSGATIATGANSKAVIVRGEEFVVISPRSQLRVPAAQAPNKIMQIIEDFGTAVFKINKKSTPHFGVQTPYLAAVVKGTTFTVTVGPRGGSVQVTEGAVEVSTLDGGAKDLVRPGGIAQVGASDLYRLTVQGETNKVIRSENGKAAGAAKPQLLAYAGPAVRAAEVRARVGEGRKSLSETTDGLVEGNSGMGSAHADVKDLERGRGNGNASENGEGNGNAGDNGNGSDSGNGNPPEPGSGNGPPATPGDGNGTTPAEPGNGGGTQPADPGHGSGTPPTDPGSGGGSPPADPGAGSGTPPVDPGNDGGSPPADPGEGSGTPPADPGNDGGSPPADPGEGSGTPPADPGNGGGDQGSGSSGGDNGSDDSDKGDEDGSGSDGGDSDKGDDDSSGDGGDSDKGDDDNDDSSGGGDSDKGDDDDSSGSDDGDSDKGDDDDNDSSDSDDEDDKSGSDSDDDDDNSGSGSGSSGSGSGGSGSGDTSGSGSGGGLLGGVIDAVGSLITPR